MKDLERVDCIPLTNPAVPSVWSKEHFSLILCQILNQLDATLWFRIWLWSLLNIHDGSACVAYSSICWCNTRYPPLVSLIWFPFHSNWDQTMSACAIMCADSPQLHLWRPGIILTVKPIPHCTPAPAYLYNSLESFMHFGWMKLIITNNLLWWTNLAFKSGHSKGTTDLYYSNFPSHNIE